MAERGASPRVTVRDAATVMLLREGGHGPEVLMVQRSPRTVFGAGKYVFPGGALDAGDLPGEQAPWCRGLDDAQASRLLGVSRGGLAFWVAAVRESFEEVGLLLALDHTGAYPAWREGAPAHERFRQHRQALRTGQADFASVCHSETVCIPADRLAYTSHWVTPPGPPRRFSARFFLALAPEGQPTQVDGQEVVAHRWLRPAKALDAHLRGDIGLMRPTRAQLEWLSAFDSAAAAMAAAHDRALSASVAPAGAGGGAHRPVHAGTKAGHEG